MVLVIQLVLNNLSMYKFPLTFLVSAELMDTIQFSVVHIYSQ